MNSSLWIVIVLGIIQGFTEFFPVSSSGHLVLAEALFGVGAGDEARGLILEIALHVGTLGAVVFFYRRKIARLLGALWSVLARGRTGFGGNRAEVGYIGLIAIGLVPAVLVGLFLHEEVTEAFDSPVLASVCLIATALFLLASRRRLAAWRLDWRAALLIGCAQALAILPGLSRSGWTIATGLLVGVGFAEAAEFSFVMSIPAVAGALALELAKSPLEVSAGALAPLVLGAAAAFVAGWIALRFLVRILAAGHFHRFAYYLLPVGIAALIFFSR